MRGLPRWRWRLSPEPFYRFCINLLTRAIYRPRYIGFDRIPKKGPAILVSNHVSYMDGPILNAALRRPVRYVIDDEIYHWPVVHYFMKHNRAIPIAPNRASVERALDEISRGLKAGDIICIFPEGQLTYTGSLGRFKPGIEHMVRRDPVPVYPVALHGLWGSIFSRKKLGWRRCIPLRRRSRVVAICGESIDPHKVSVNYLQALVLRLKYSLGEEPPLR